MNATITTTCQAAAKSHLVELIMMRWGRFQPHTQSTRRLLEADSFENLQKLFEGIVSGAVPVIQFQGGEL